MTSDGDMNYGASQLEFLVNSPAAVAQAILTRLKLIRGEWFLDSSVGMPWRTEVLGVRTQPTYDRAIRDCISNTQGFSAFVSYSSEVVAPRRLQVNAEVTTIYSSDPVTISMVL